MIMDGTNACILDVEAINSEVIGEDQRKERTPKVDPGETPEIMTAHKDDTTQEQKSKIVEMIHDQQSDETLESCFAAARKADKEFYIRQLDGLLFHIGQVMGRTVHQLVLPRKHRAEVLYMGHDIDWAGHLAAEKTYQRIAISFFWPSMRKEITTYCKSCSSCQMKRRKTCWDRIPITAVTRPNQTFEVMNFDLIGPFENKSKGHAYVLTLIDQCSRWVEGVPLRNLHAKTICEALLWIFARTGIPKVLVTDNASYNTAKLTAEFTRRLGVTPRFSTPWHPEGNAVIERYNAVIKGMIHHVIRAGVKEWHKLIPYLLWAYREIPNATTGIAPYEMVYGKKTRGPLAVLRETWTGEQTIPIELAKPAKEYLNQLKENLEIAKDIAEEHAGKNQRRYTDNYNLRSRSKSFEVDDKVIILMPDSGNKVYSRWIGPAKIRKKLSENSYNVELDDGSV
jgi:transposase InsO family protein